MTNFRPKDKTIVGPDGRLLFEWDAYFDRLNRTVNSGVRMLSRGLQSGSSATISGIPDECSLLELDITGVTPATDGASLYMRLGFQGSFFDGASDYSYANLREGTHSNSSGAAQFEIASGLDSGLASFMTVRIYAPRKRGAVLRTFASWHGLAMDSTASARTVTSGAGRLGATTGDIDSVEFFMSAGDISGAYIIARSYP